MIPASLALALVLGMLADLAAGAVTRLTGARRAWWGAVRRLPGDVRLLARDRDRASLLEAAGTGAALLGAALAAGAAAGAVPGSAVLVYLALVLAAGGGQLAAASPLTEDGAARAGLARRAAVMAEPAFALALLACFLRWRASGLDAVRGAADVLGAPLALGPEVAAAGLALALVAMVAAGGLRLAPAPGDEQGAGGGTALALTVSRWSVSGATCLVAGVLAMGGGPGLGSLLPALGAAAVAALVLGGSAAGIAALPPALRLLAGPGLLVLAAAAAGLVQAG